LSLNLEKIKENEKLFNIALSVSFALAFTVINISHQLLFKVSDFIVGVKSPINLLIHPFSGFKTPVEGETIANRIFWLKKGEILNKYHIDTLKLFFKDPTTEFIVYTFLFSIILLLFLSIVNSSRKEKIILLIAILAIVIYTKYTATYSTISIYTLPFIGILGLFVVFLETSTVKVLNLLLAFIISIVYAFNPFIIFSFVISGGFSLFLYKKDEKDINYVFPFIVGSVLLALLASVFNLFSNIPIHFDLINISWSLIALPILYLTIQLLKVYSPLFKKYDLMNYLDMEHPLLKMIKEKTPGTYKHSIDMANIVEPIANQIGANGLLCRTGAYFHDIGKIKHPKFFIENQDGENPHDSLSPIESARMIKLHVEDGMLLAEEYNLPDYISQFIDKHHGTTILEYFYEKAASVEGAEVNVEDFRYPGRKPDNKETALLMIVDAVEAASNSLTDPSPQEMEALITKIIFSKLLFNQLTLSGITLSDLRKIIVGLIEALKNNSHTRVKYPWQTKTIKKEK